MKIFIHDQCHHQHKKEKQYQEKIEYIIDEKLKSYIKKKLTDTVHKYFPDAIKADVHFMQNGPLVHTEIIVHDGVSHSVLIKSRANDDEIYKSFHQALHRVDKQLRRYRKKLRHHKKKTDNYAALSQSGTKYTIEPLENEEDTCLKSGPAIISDKVTEFEILSVKEAVMRMDLEHLPAKVFINVNDHHVNIVYYRFDGNIAWIDTKNKVDLKLNA